MSARGASLLLDSESARVRNARARTRSSDMLRLGQRSRFNSPMQQSRVAPRPQLEVGVDVLTPQFNRETLKTLREGPCRSRVVYWGDMSVNEADVVQFPVNAHFGDTTTSAAAGNCFLAYVQDAQVYILGHCLLNPHTSPHALGFDANSMIPAIQNPNPLAAPSSPHHIPSSVRKITHAPLLASSMSASVPGARGSCWSDEHVARSFQADGDRDAALRERRGDKQKRAKSAAFVLDMDPQLRDHLRELREAMGADGALEDAEVTPAEGEEEGEEGQEGERNDGDQAEGERGERSSGEEASNKQNGEEKNGQDEAKTDIERDPRFVGVECGPDFVLGLDEVGRLFSCGNNDCGQLGLGHTHVCYQMTLTRSVYPHPCLGEEEMAPNREPSNVHKDMLKLDVRSRVGFRGLRSSRSSSPTTIINHNLLPDADQAAGGRRLSSHAHVHTHLQPVLYCRVAAGDRHAVAVLDCRSAVMVWGDGSYGQLGEVRLNDDHCCLWPTKLPLPVELEQHGRQPGIKDVACGSAHTVVLTDKSVIVCFGNNKQKQLGCEKSTATTNIVDVLRGIRFLGVMAGGSTSAALALSGDVWLWGRVGANVCSLPTKLADVNNCVGAMVSSSTFVAVTEARHLYALNLQAPVVTPEKSDSGLPLSPELLCVLTQNCLWLSGCNNTFSLAMDAPKRTIGSIFLTYARSTLLFMRQVEQFVKTTEAIGYTVSELRRDVLLVILQTHEHFIANVYVYLANGCSPVLLLRTLKEMAQPISAAHLDFVKTYEACLHTMHDPKNWGQSKSQSRLQQLHSEVQRRLGITLEDFLNLPLAHFTKFVNLVDELLDHNKPFFRPFYSIKPYMNEAREALQDKLVEANWRCLGEHFKTDVLEDLNYDHRTFVRFEVLKRGVLLLFSDCLVCATCKQDLLRLTKKPMELQSRVVIPLKLLWVETPPDHGNANEEDSMVLSLTGPEQQREVLVRDTRQLREWVQRLRMAIRESLSRDAMLQHDQQANMRAAGDTSCGRLGISAGLVRRLTTLKLATDHPLAFVRIACGTTHTLGLTEEGQVFQWGKLENQELGTSPLLVLDEVVDIACGEAHCLAVRSTGSVYAWGKGSAGQLGLNTRESHELPQLVTHLDGLGETKIKSVTCGERFSAALTLDGFVLTWGSARFGELGRGRREDTSLVPLRVSQLSIQVAQIVAGPYHMAALTVSGAVFLWGRNDDGQSSPKVLCGHLSEPTLLETSLPFRQVGCGAIFTCGLTITGQVMMWGSFHCGANTEPTHSLRQVKGCPYAIRLAAGYDHCAIVTESDELYTWGKNAHGCLAHDNNEHLESPKQVFSSHHDLLVWDVVCGNGVTFVLSRSIKRHASYTFREQIVVDPAGTVVIPQGAKYEGDWKRGRLQGCGKLTYPNKEVYEGEFEDSQRCGEGCYTNRHGNVVYLGQYDCDKRHGFGVSRESLTDGDAKQGKGGVYVGDWQNGKRDGFGVFVVDGSTLMFGEWSQNERHGCGIIVQAHRWREGNSASNISSGSGLVLEDEDDDDGEGGENCFLPAFAVGVLEMCSQRALRTETTLFRGTWEHDEVLGEGTLFLSGGFHTLSGTFSASFPNLHVNGSIEANNHRKPWPIRDLDFSLLWMEPMLRDERVYLSCLQHHLVSVLLDPAHQLGQLRERAANRIISLVDSGASFAVISEALADGMNEVCNTVCELYVGCSRESRCGAAALPYVFAAAEHVLYSNTYAQVQSIVLREHHDAVAKYMQSVGRVGMTRQLRVQAARRLLCDETQQALADVPLALWFANAIDQLEKLLDCPSGVTKVLCFQRMEIQIHDFCDTYQVKKEPDELMEMRHFVLAVAAAPALPVHLQIADASAAFYMDSGAETRVQLLISVVSYLVAELDKWE